MLSTDEYAIYSKIRNAYCESNEKSFDQSTKQFLMWLISNNMLASKPTINKALRAIKANDIIRGWVE